MLQCGYCTAKISKAFQHTRSSEGSPVRCVVRQPLTLCTLEVFFFFVNDNDVGNVLQMRSFSSQDISLILLNEVMWDVYCSLFIRWVILLLYRGCIVWCCAAFVRCCAALCCGSAICVCVSYMETWKWNCTVRTHTQKSVGRACVWRCEHDLITVLWIHLRNECSKSFQKKERTVAARVVKCVGIHVIKSCYENKVGMTIWTCCAQTDATTYWTIARIGEPSEAYKGIVASWLPADSQVCKECKIEWV